ncbi:peptidoglycan-binding domain-containing protein [Actibacterium pelagium]|uniref:Peptidoglycan binding-like domain-containing protein n=1 Tax=Actibacterium pelagium TaxID=2029103 RepID=A0A917AML2_9RHOB|nr:peptidoglycan-binding domain-containing protein [Actibacterium pelagium]GGE60937.1 hypothetical protein GCM10011517_30580 [Actibacterium pelagium]
MTKLPPARAKKLQELLNRVVKPKPPLSVDGIVGKKTTAALKQMQGMAGLKKSGVVDAETASVIARAMKTGKVEKEQPKHYFKVGGKVVGMTEKEYQAYKKKLIRDLRRGPVLQMKINAEAAMFEWEHFDKLNKDQWFVSLCIETTRGANLPPKSMMTHAIKCYQQVEGALAAGDIKKFSTIYPKCEMAVNDAVNKMRNYRIQMIEGGGNWVTGLTFTKTASFTFVGIFAAPAAGAALGTGALASAVIGGAAVATTESAASEVGNWSAGKKNWTPGGALLNVVIDGSIGAIIGYFTKGGSGGKHVVEAAVEKLLPKLAKETGFKLLSKTALKKAAMFLMTEGLKKTVEDALKDAAKMAKGDKTMTMDKFLNNMVMNFVKGAALGPVGKVIEKFAKNAADNMDPRHEKMLWDAALAEASKQAKGRTIHISMVDKKATDQIAAAINKTTSKVFDAVVGDIYDKWKGPMSPAAFEKELRAKLWTPAMIKQISKEAGKIIAKSAKVAS